MKNNSIKLLEQQIVKTWSPRIQKKLSEKGIKVTNEKLNLLCKMAHVRALEANKVNESYANLDNTPGRGGVNFGNNPNAGYPGLYGAGSKGSAEVWQNLFSVFIEIAATNIGMELVPTVPQTKSSGTYYVAEPIYGEGRMESAANKPLLIQVKLTVNGAIVTDIPMDDTNVGQTFTVKESGGDSIIDLIFVGKHRVNGYPCFKVGKAYNNTGGGGTDYTGEVLADCLDSAANGARITGSAPGNFWSFSADSVDYVAGFTNFVSGWSGAGANDGDDWFMNRGDGKRYSKPMTRKTGERTYYRSMGVRTWHKNFSAETVHTDIQYTTEQIQDMQNDLGMSAFEFGDMIVQDQLNQHINGHILGRMFALGWEHHWAMNQANSSFNLNAFIASAASTGAAQAFLGKDDVLKTISGPSGVLPSAGAIAENLSTLQRRIITRLLYASGIIKAKSRRGRGDQVVLNTTFGTAVRDIRGFQPAPFDNTIEACSDLEMIGSLYGMKVYEDGLMDFNDERINVSRHGNEKDPGIKFCPYVLAEKVSTVAEGTMSQKDALKSRYSLVEAGTNPELNYLTFTVESEAGYSIV